MTLSQQKSQIGAGPQTEKVFNSSPAVGEQVANIVNKEVGGWGPRGDTKGTHISRQLPQSGVCMHAEVDIVVAWGDGGMWW